MKALRRASRQFRHTCASELIAARVRLSEVQRILGHSGIGTTMRWIVRLLRAKLIAKRHCSELCTVSALVVEGSTIVVQLSALEQARNAVDTSHEKASARRQKCGSGGCPFDDGNSRLTSSCC